MNPHKGAGSGLAGQSPSTDVPASPLPWHRAASSRKSIHLPDFGTCSCLAVELFASLLLTSAFFTQDQQTSSWRSSPGRTRRDWNPSFAAH